MSGSCALFEKNKYPTTQLTVYNKTLYMHIKKKTSETF